MQNKALTLTVDLTNFDLKYLKAYSQNTQLQVLALVEQNKLAEVLLQKYPSAHAITTDKALYEYVLALKNIYLRNAAPLNKALFDSKIQVIKHALGLHTTLSRVQGSRLTTKREIRIATLFKETPIEFLKMIVVHELAHFKERNHDKAFYQLCLSMEPNYHQLEFDLRLYLTHMDLYKQPIWRI